MEPAMLVPKHRENDWIFATESGHLQLLLGSPGISRLILIGSASNGEISVGNLYKSSIENCPIYREKLERSLYPLLMALLPKEIAQLGNVEVPFLSYEDSVISSVVLERSTGSCVGEMLVEDVEIEGSRREFRRRLRFKRMPNLIQTEISVVPNNGVDDTGLNSLCIEEAEFCLDLGVLVHPYLAPMVAGLSLISGYLQECFESKVRPRGLCIGVGGGALLSFLSLQLGFEVVGIEMDEAVLRIAKQYFGLQSGNSIQLCLGDGIEILKKVALFDCDNALSPSVANNAGEEHCKDYFELFGPKFLVIMVDLDSSDSKMGISAPALEFLQKDVLLAAKTSLSEHGILVLNVIPPNGSFYDMLIHELQGVYVDLHEIDCGNGENFVLIASKTSVTCSNSVSENAFLRKLKSVISGTFVDFIRKM
ncbi:methyltransferase-like protein 13 isoform X2 [Chenopodium quinoa]|uniref:methyltransferase-like protein 13 isoform X2 n=1 Tax=Chenopodium quinoa TaxID=63459 RepID=UPI000B776969|nr:methyltransferase-like protein 13 isoform X2 [Chenopodium quinoa]